MVARLLAWCGRATPPALLFALSGFFLWHVHLGSERLDDLRAQVAAAEAGLAEAAAGRELARRRVDALRGDVLDPDQLEARARILLNMSRPDEVVIPYGPQGRLF